MGRPMLSVEEKARRGTLKPSLERAYQARAILDRIAEPELEALQDRALAPLVDARDYLGLADQYAADVTSGAIVACGLVRLAVARDGRDRARSAAGAPFVWCDDEAHKACHFLEQLPHVEGRWATPTLVLELWQCWLVTRLFGWRKRSDLARRRFTTLYLEVARKAAKSTLFGAGVALYHLLREQEPGVQVVCGATTGQQARIVFGLMQAMVKKSAWLRAHGLAVMANSLTLSDGGSAKPINAKASSQDGLNPSCIVLDEGHAQNFALHDVLKSAQGARTNPLMLCPTTAGYDLLSVGYALRGQLTKVLDGVFEADHLFGAIYTLDDGDDWRDEAVWGKANPMIGISPTWDYVRTYCQDAQQAPGLEGEFRVKICNQWSQSASTWLPMTAWDACADLTLRLEQFAGEPCWIGGDLAQIDDLTALAYLFARGSLLYGFVRAYLPEGVVDERARAVPAYREWVRSGLLTATDGTMVDMARIEADLRADAARFKVQALSFDQFGSAQLVSTLAADRWPAVIEPKNAKTMTPPARELEARVLHGQFRHDGNSLLKWAASNAVVTRRIDDTILPKKDAPESPNKIDPLDALLQAMSAWLRRPSARRSEPQLLIIGGRR